MLLKRMAAMRPCMMALLTTLTLAAAVSASAMDDRLIYQEGEMPETPKHVSVEVGQNAPDFTLTSLHRGDVTLSDYRGKNNVLLTFVPAAWTPVCSDQWPGYNIAKKFFDDTDTVVLGITVDNLPTLHAWVEEMGGLWFPVLSDFWPHGEVARRYGVLRPDGMTERALILLDKKGVVRYIDIHDINKRPDLGVLVRELNKLEQP